eukprot:485678-Hanusia_phi.AAC.1
MLPPWLARPRVLGPPRPSCLPPWLPFSRVVFPLLLRPQRLCQVPPCPPVPDVSDGLGRHAVPEPHGGARRRLDFLVVGAELVDLDDGVAGEYSSSTEAV